MIDQDIYKFTLMFKLVSISEVIRGLEAQRSFRLATKMIYLSEYEPVDLCG